MIKLSSFSDSSTVPTDAKASMNVGIAFWNHINTLTSFKTASVSAVNNAYAY